MALTASAAAPPPPLPPSRAEMDLARVLLGLELGMHWMALPVALCSLALLARTSVLHFNLKFLLLCQTVAILLRSLLRVPAISVKFARGNPFWSESEWPVLQAGLLMAVFFRNFLGHVMTAERLLATAYSQNYEWQRRFRWFSPGWFVPLMLLAIWNAWTPAVTGLERHGYFSLTSAVNLATGQGTLLCNVVEFAVIALLLRYNQRKFVRSGAKRNEHNLSERYQLLENVRTTRQLLPVLALHSLSNLNNSAIQLGQLFRPMPGSALQFLLDTNALGFFNASVITLAILFATIFCHPILRRNATIGLQKMRTSLLGRKGSSAVGPATMTTNSSTLWTSSKEQQLMKDQYFRVLNNFWEVEAVKKMAAAPDCAGNQG